MTEVCTLLGALQLTCHNLTVITLAFLTLKHISRHIHRSAYIRGDGGGGHWLVQMEWRPARWSVCLPLLIFPCIIKSRSSLLALAHLGGPGKKAVKQLRCSDLHQVPVKLFGNNFIHREPKSLVEERTKPDVVLKNNYFLVVVCQNLGAQYNTMIGTMH